MARLPRLNMERCPQHIIQRELMGVVTRAGLEHGSKDNNNTARKR